ncbi:MAG: phage tail assembly chaperone [Pseudomonadota bacterium]
MSFRAAAPQWFALAARALGWRPDDFWSATPSELVGALHDPNTSSNEALPDAQLIRRMMERDSNGR